MPFLFFLGGTEKGNSGEVGSISTSPQEYKETTPRGNAITYTCCWAAGSVGQLKLAISPFGRRTQYPTKTRVLHTNRLAVVTRRGGYLPGRAGEGAFMVIS